MIIQSSNVGMSSSRTYNRTTSRSLSMSMKTATIAAAVKGGVLSQAADQQSSTKNNAAQNNGASASSKNSSTKNNAAQNNGASASSKNSSTKNNAASQAQDAAKKRENFWNFLQSDMEDSTTEKIEDSLTSGNTEASQTGSKAAPTIAASRISPAGYRDAIDSIRKRCIAYLMAIFYGTDDSRYQDLMSETGGGTSGDETTDGTAQGTSDNSLKGTSNLTGVGSLSASSMGLFQVQTFQISAEQTYEETENTSFATKGKVVNADGTEIEFNLSVDMTRSFKESFKSIATQTDIKMIDPLVINLDTNIAGLSDQKFQFDIDADGVLDTISTLNKGSGYLALDQNQDGKINDGSELFGTKSGDGFEDLAKYDEDGNGWIDENDSVFDKLMIWCKNDTGEDSLYHLTDKGVGAICLNSAQTDFSLNSMKNNAANGAIRRTGIFLYESGTVGTMQHIDVAN